MGTILPYAPVPSPPRSVARIIRFSVLALGVACFGFAVVLIMGQLKLGAADVGPALYGTPLAPAGTTDADGFPWAIGRESTYYIWASVLIGLFLLGQWFFLLPRGQWRINLAQTPRPMKRAAVAAGAIATLLVSGVVATLMDFGQLWQHATMPEAVGKAFSSGFQDYRIIWLVMLAIWIAWAVAFFSYFKSQSDGYTSFTRVFRGLVAGTVLELLVAAPVHAFHTDKEDCYCARGSYTGLVFGCTAAVWLFGPGIFLLFLRENRRRGALLEQTKLG